MSRQGPRSEPGCGGSVFITVALACVKLPVISGPHQRPRIASPTRCQAETQLSLMGWDGFFFLECCSHELTTLFVSIWCVNAPLHIAADGSCQGHGCPWPRTSSHSPRTREWEPCCGPEPGRWADPDSRLQNPLWAGERVDGWMDGLVDW